MAEQPPIPLQVGDVANEMALLAAAMLDYEVRERLVQRVRPEHFLVEEHRHFWAALQEIERRKLDYDHALLVRLAGGRVRAGYAEAILAARPESPNATNITQHEKNLRWDHQRALAIRGPITSLLEALRDPTQPRERVAALAKHVGESLAGGGESWLQDSSTLVARVADDLRRRRGGRGAWPFGLDALDRYESGCRNARGEDVGGRPRLTPGAKAGMLTVITGLSGHCKSTVGSRLALGLCRQKKKVLYCPWEPGSDMTLEFMAALDLGWNRDDMQWNGLEEDEIVQLEERCHELGKFITFMENPFQRTRSDRPSNEANLDLVHQHVVDSGCDVAFFDLWDRVLEDSRPDAVKRALWRTHSIAEQTKTHLVPMVQQNPKGEHARSDGFPTIENMFGSSEWVMVGDTILGTYRPGMRKGVPDDVLQIAVLKQRWGAFPQLIEFRWDGEYGTIEDGKTVPFNFKEGTSADNDLFTAPRAPPGSKRRNRGND